VLAALFLVLMYVSADGEYSYNPYNNYDYQGYHQDDYGSIYGYYKEHPGQYGYGTKYDPFRYDYPQYPTYDYDGPYYPKF
jgi:hypothetical protein